VISSPVSTTLGRPLWIFIVATALSLTGTFIQKIAVGWSVWEATHSATWVAAAALADLVPTLVLSVPAGALIDRFRPAPMFWTSQVASALQALLLSLLSASGHLSIGVLIGCAIFLGACNAFTLLARLAYLMQLTPRGSYPRAVALYSLSGNAAFFAGPMLGGELLSSFGTVAAFAANALAYVPMICVVLTLRPIEADPIGRPAHAGVLQTMREGIGYTVRSPEILTMLLSFAAAACTARGIMELAPTVAAAALHGDVRTLAYLTSTIAVGALLGGVWMSRGGILSERTMIMVTLSGTAVALLGYGASGQILLALGGALLMGFVLAINNIAVTSAIQLHSPVQYRGRVNSIYNMIFKGGPAVGAVVFGWLAQATNIRLASAVAAVVLVASMVWIIKRTLPATDIGAKEQSRFDPRAAE
jgi:MFS family permease